VYLNDNLLRRGLYLEYITLAWNIVGSGLILAVAVSTGSVAFAGFGIDSLIEIFASVVVVWQLKSIGKQREGYALRLISVAFFALAIYVLLQSGNTLLTQSHPQTSVFGILWLAATLIAMLLLAWGKYQTGKKLNNAVLLTEGRVTLVDAYLAASVLVGVLLNSLWGLWWADPLAALIVVYYGFREGLHAWREAKILAS
jgi:divalent metal cation (Fe/Co/Zn/Cd) transporter